MGSTDKVDERKGEKREGRRSALLHIPAPLSFVVTSMSTARPQFPWQKLSGLLAYGVTSI